MRNRDELLGHPVVGRSWEGFVLEQLAAASPAGWELGFWRTAGGAEIDLLLLYGGEPRIALEMKMNATSPRPARGFFHGCEDLQPEHRWIVHPGDAILPLGQGVLAMPVEDAVARFVEISGA